MPPTTTTRKTHRCHQCNHTARALVFKNKRGRGWIRRKRGKKKRVKNLCMDQRRAFKRTKQIRNKQHSCWLYYTTQVPHTKGPTCWAPVWGEQCKNGLHLAAKQEGRERERESGIERGSGRRRKKRESIVKWTTFVSHSSHPFYPLRTVTDSNVSLPAFINF